MYFCWPVELALRSGTLVAEAPYKKKSMIGEKLVLERVPPLTHERLRCVRACFCCMCLSSAAAFEVLKELHDPLFELSSAFVAACWLADIRRGGPTRRVEAPSSLCLVACCNEGAQLEV